MKHALTLIAILVFTATLFAANPPGSGGDCGGHCCVCQYHDRGEVCQAHGGWASEPWIGADMGWRECNESKPEIGPWFCELGGDTCWYYTVGNGGNVPINDAVWQIAKIGVFFVEFGAITANEFLDFAAEVDARVGGGNSAKETLARLAVYRAEYARIVGHELPPGLFPQMPKRLATTTQMADARKGDGDGY